MSCGGWANAEAPFSIACLDRRAFLGDADHSARCSISDLIREVDNDEMCETVNIRSQISGAVISKGWPRKGANPKKILENQPATSHMHWFAVENQFSSPSSTTSTCVCAYVNIPSLSSFLPSPSSTAPLPLPFFFGFRLRVCMPSFRMASGRLTPCSL